MVKTLVQSSIVFGLQAVAAECPPQLRTFQLFDRQNTAPSCIDQWQQAIDAMKSGDTVKPVLTFG